MSTVMRYRDLKPGQHFMVATEGLRGHFACEMWMNNKDFDDTVFPEPYESDFETYETHADAVERAKELAEVNNLPYVE